MNRGEGKTSEEKEDGKHRSRAGEPSSRSGRNKSEQKQNEDDDSSASQQMSVGSGGGKSSKQSDKHEESKGNDEAKGKRKILKDKAKPSKSDQSVEKEDKQKQRAEEVSNRRKKKAGDDEKTRLTEENSVHSASTNQASQLSMCERALSGWAPLSQSIEDRDGDISSCFPTITEDLIDNTCFSRDECSWMCCRSERLGGFGYCVQSMLCIPMLCMNRCAGSCFHSCLICIGECPCMTYLKLGLHHQSRARDPVTLADTREFLKRHQERGHEDDVCLIRVIGCDRPLLERVSVLHPMVRVHAVDIQTGRYLKRKKRDDMLRDVEPKGCITTYESSTVMTTSKVVDVNEDSVGIDLQYNQDCDRLLPVSTTPFPLKRCMEPPKWQDGGGDLIINESYDTILDPETLLLVEICDFTSAGISSRKHDQGSDSGYVGIAWGFLMPVSRSGRPCIGIRGGSINNEELGATPRDMGSKYIPTNKTVYEEAERVNKRLTLQLFKWRHNIDPIALAQARHRGILPLSAPATSEVPAVYLQWYLRHRKPYPVTLALRVGPISRPRVQRVSYRPNNCFQVERGNKSKEEHLSDLGDDEVEMSDVGETTEGDIANTKRVSGKTGKVNEAIARRQWSQGNKCALPNKLLVRKSLGNSGATALKYSHCGKWLAVAVSDPSGKLPVVIFDLDEEEGVAKRSAVLRGHSSIVHDIDWSDDNRFLVTASGDGSAIVWSLEHITDKKKRRRSVERLASTDVDASSSPSSPAIASPGSPSSSGHRRLGAFAVRVLYPSPSVVYAARFVPRHRPGPQADTPSAHALCPLIVTGSFDGQLVLWDPCQDQPNLGLLGQLQAPLHRFSVTALVVEQRNRRVFSGDSDGIVWAWALTQPSTSSQTPTKQDGEGPLPLYHPESRPIIHNSLRGRTITSLEVQPTKSTRKGGSNLLVAAHGNLVLLFDSEAKALLAQYHGANLHVSHIRARFSPDARYVISGSEDGCVVVWDTQASTKNSSSDMASPVISHNKKLCALSSMGFNAPLLDIAWNPKQHCVAMVASGGSFPLLVAYSESAPKEASKEEELLATLMEPALPHMHENSFANPFQTTLRKENIGIQKRMSISEVLRQSANQLDGGGPSNRGSRGSSLRRPSLSNVLKDSLRRETFSNLASPSGKDNSFADGFGASFGGSGTPSGRLNLSGLSTPTGKNTSSFSQLLSNQSSSTRQGVRSLAKAKLSEIRARQFLDQDGDQDSVSGDGMATPSHFERSRDLAPLSEGAGSSLASPELKPSTSAIELKELPLASDVQPKSSAMDASFH